MTEIIKLLEKLNIKDYELYGKYMAKIDYKPSDMKGKLVLVTSINPTPYGEGKTTTSIGLVDSLNKIGVNAIASLREPSMGPVFGKKGGAVGGGKALIVPEKKINLNFTGDFHAITYANNLIAAVIDNSIYQGNELGIDRVVFNRCLDVNDRSLRHVMINGKETSFMITTASEMMSIVGLSETMEDLRTNLGNILVGYTKDNKEIYVKDLKLVDSLLYILEDAVKPNLVSTLYNNPVIVHTGPFANISYGSSSIKSIKLGLSLSDYCITEAGFGSDTGAMKFLDMLCRKGNLYPDVIVLNCTVRALKYHGNGDLNEGIKNLEYHILNMSKFTSNLIISINKFNDDTEEDINIIRELGNKYNLKVCLSTMFSDGEDGCIDLANEITKMGPNTKHFDIYDLNDDLFTKIDKIKDMFYAKEIVYSDEVKSKLELINKNNKGLPICVCKTPYSISDNDKVLNFPKDYTMTITDAKVFSGAGYIVLYMGNVMTMPGLAKESNYLKDKYE